MQKSYLSLKMSVLALAISVAPQAFAQDDDAEEATSGRRTGRENEEDKKDGSE